MAKEISKESLIAELDRQCKIIAPKRRQLLTTAIAMGVPNATRISSDRLFEIVNSN